MTAEQKLSHLLPICEKLITYDPADLFGPQSVCVIRSIINPREAKIQSDFCGLISQLASILADEDFQ